MTSMIDGEVGTKMANKSDLQVKESVAKGTEDIGHWIRMFGGA